MKTACLFCEHDCCDICVQGQSLDRSDPPEGGDPDG